MINSICFSLVLWKEKCQQQQGGLCFFYCFRIILKKGWINTEMNSGLDNESKKKFIAEIPLGRFLEPKEIAEAILYLVKAGVTGEVLIVDGGNNLK